MGGLGLELCTFVLAVGRGHILQPLFVLDRAHRLLSVFTRLVLGTEVVRIRHDDLFPIDLWVIRAKGPKVDRTTLCVNVLLSKTGKGRDEG